MSIIIIAASILAVVSIPLVVVGVLLTLHWRRSKLSNLEARPLNSCSELYSNVFTGSGRCYRWTPY